MRLLHIADIHLERSFRWLGRTRGDDRRRELRATLTRAIDRARDEQVDAVCIAGDLFERENATPVVGDFLRDTFQGINPIPVLIAPGNRDFFSAGCLYDRVAWSPNVHIFTDSSPGPYGIADGTIWGAAFVDARRQQSPLEGFRVDDGRLHVGLFHADVVEDAAGSAFGPLDPAEIERAGLAFALLGHVHHGKVDETRRFAYPGSIEPLDATEDGAHGALVVDVTRTGRSIQRIDLAPRRAISDTIDVSEISRVSDLNHLLEIRRPSWVNNDVRLRVCGSLQGELLAHPEAIRDALVGIDVDLEWDAWPAADLDDAEYQRTILGAFVREARLRISEAATGDEVSHWEDVLAAGIAAFHDSEVILR
jgi:exonuclease SbcD